MVSHGAWASSQDVRAASYSSRVAHSDASDASWTTAESEFVTGSESDGERR